MIGSVIGQRYRVVRILGQGGMGVVYEADDLVGGARVALKLITGDLARNASLVVRFEQERKVAAAIDTPHIARLLDSGTDGDRPYMVMEYLRGEDVGELLKRLGVVAPDLALRMAAQAAEGLRKAHEAGIVHRDIKPANLFVAQAEGGRRTVKLLDFGVAKIKLDWATSDEAGGLTRTGAMLGSPLYMAPEQARGSRKVDDRADLWSLGVVLYRALAGRVPNQDIDGLGELIIAICTKAPPSVRDVAPWVPREVEAIVQRALALDPADRFGSALAMLEAIRALIPSDEIDEGMLVPLSPELRVRPSAASSIESVPSSTAPSKRGAGRRILIVEDNEMNMDMLSRRLTRKGFTILMATDGESGVAKCKAELPDLVLMDVSLPGMDGWSATRAIRADEATRKTPIIALTAHALTSDRDRAFEVGCDDYETKPVDLPRLLAKIDKLLVRGAGAARGVT